MGARIVIEVSPRQRNALKVVTQWQAICNVDGKPITEVSHEKNGAVNRLVFRLIREKVILVRENGND